MFHTEIRCDDCNIPFGATDYCGASKTHRSLMEADCLKAGWTNNDGHWGPKSHWCLDCSEKQQQVTNRLEAVSAVPCSLCGGPVIEFTVPNEVWNTVVRRGGPETDREYLCVGCYHKAVNEYVLK